MTVFMESTQKLIYRHPYFADLMLLFVMPICMIVAVSVATVILTLPIAWIFGWL